MNPVIDAIRSRRSVRIMRTDVVPSRDQIEAIVEAATWAPNHHLTEPWRFVIITGYGRNRLGEVLAQALGVQCQPSKRQIRSCSPQEHSCDKEDFWDERL